MNLFELVRWHAVEMPDRIALTDKACRLDWSTLQARVLGTARHLKHEGIEPGDVVGVAMRSSIELSVAVLALAHLGAIFCSIDWRQRPAERRAVFETIGAKTVLTDVAAAAPDTSVMHIEPGKWMGSLADIGDPAPFNPGATSALILSSGTTARPKAVALSHQAQAWRTILRGRDDGLQRGMAVLHMLAPWTSAGISGLLANLCAGVTTHIHPLLFSSEELVDALQRHKIAHVTMVPAVLQSLLKFAGEKRLDLPDLIGLVMLGSPFSPEEKRAALARITPHLYERYGSVGTGVIARAIPRDMADAPDSVGRASTFVSIEIVDDEGALMPSGATGRIRVGSPGNAIGYWNESGQDERHEVFSGRWVYPGDRGFLDKEGRLHLAGRAGSMILRGGQNLYPEEIERILVTHEAVVEAGVVGRPDAQLGEVPVAMVVTGKPISTAELRAHCARLLSPYKVPVEFHLVDDLPKTGDGKLHRAALAQRLRDKS